MSKTSYAEIEEAGQAALEAFDGDYRAAWRETEKVFGALKAAGWLNAEQETDFRDVVGWLRAGDDTIEYLTASATCATCWKPVHRIEGGKLGTRWEHVDAPEPMIGEHAVEVDETSITGLATACY